MTRNDPLATILLVSRLHSDGLLPLRAAEFWRLSAQVDRPGELLGLSAADLRARHGLSGELSERVVSLLGRGTTMAFELDRLEQSGIAVLTPHDADYPQRLLTRLAAKAPPLLYAAGAVELFGRGGVGIVGSRTVSAEGGEVAKAAAGRAAGLGLPVVSGGATGVDQLAMTAALEAGGSVIGFLADSLARTLKRPEVRRAVHNGATVLCTPYSPDAPFSTGNAMGRNRLIYAQAHVTLVVAAEDGSGGTWSGAVEALEARYGTEAVWRGAGEGPGNRPLEARGATPITSVDSLDDLLANPDPEPAQAQPRLSPAQPSLFDGGSPSE